MLIQMIKNVRTQLEQLRDTLAKPLADRKMRYDANQVLNQMGFEPNEISALISYAGYHQLNSQCIGQLVWQVAKGEQITPREAGRRLSEGYYWYEWREKIAEGKV